MTGLSVWRLIVEKEEKQEENRDREKDDVMKILREEKCRDLGLISRN